MSMKIKKSAVAGTMESGDVMVTIRPNQGQGIQIDLQSTVEKQFGKQIRKVVEETVKGFEICDAKVTVVDKGALDCTIRARVSAVVHRASENAEYSWKKIV